MLLNKRLWAVLLAAMLVAGLLVGFGNGDDAVAKEPRATVGRTMIIPPALLPVSSTTQYLSGGWTMVSAGGSFIAQVPLSAPVVTIRKITLLANDPVAADVCVTVWRSQPLIPSEVQMGGVCTTGSTGFQKVTAPPLTNRRVNSANHGMYLYVTIGPSTVFSGVQVVYSY